MLFVFACFWNLNKWNHIEYVFLLFASLAQYWVCEFYSLYVFPLYKYTKIVLTNLMLMDSWTISSSDYSKHACRDTDHNVSCRLVGLWEIPGFIWNFSNRILSICFIRSTVSAKECQKVCQGDCISLHSYQQCMRAPPLFLYPHHYYFLIGLLFNVCQDGGCKWIPFWFEFTYPGLPWAWALSIHSLSIMFPLLKRGLFNSFTHLLLFLIDL